MPLVANVQRRGAVYHWRRRLPASLALATEQTHLRMSLATKEPAEARFLAAQLDAFAEALFMSASGQAITSEQLAALFRNVLDAKRGMLSLTADSRRCQTEFDSDEEAQANRDFGWVYRILAKKGLGANVTGADRAQMEQAGLDGPSIASVEKMLHAMQADGRASPSAAKVKAAIRAVGAKDDLVAVSRAVPIYLRALAEAFIESGAVYHADPLPFESLMTLTIEPSEADRIAKSSKGSVEGVSTSNGPPPLTLAPVGRPPEEAELESPVRGKTISAVDLGRKLIDNMAQDEKWNGKSRAQAACTFALFDGFLKEEHGIADLALLEQRHLDGFDALLREIPKSYGKDGKGLPSIRTLREKSRSLCADAKGLSIGTRNRHYTFLGVLLKAAKKAGSKLDPDLDVTAFRSKKKCRARNERPVPPRASLSALFQAPIFVGCVSWKDQHESGTDVFHRAIYYGPMLAFYHGLRREEFCGLSVQDVVYEHTTVPYIHVRDNAIRTLKNLSSDRVLAIHPELLRLGFLDYVRTVKLHGYTHLFPDLVSPNSKSPLGDRFYDEMTGILRELGFTPHQIRHYFNNHLKQTGITEEIRADLLGHAGKSETSERYVDQIELKRQLKTTDKIPVLTAHLSPSPIQLIPWVAEGKPAPWARAPRRRGARPRAEVAVRDQCREGLVSRA